MTDQNSSERTRRTFMKGAAATGVAATGITAFSGGAAGQQRGRPSVDIVSDTDSIASGLITVQVSGVNLNALNGNNVQVLFDEEVIDIDNIEILTAGEDLVEIDLDENQILNISGTQVPVTVAILGGAASDTVQDVELDN